MRLILQTKNEDLDIKRPLFLTLGCCHGYLHADDVIDEEEQKKEQKHIGHSLIITHIHTHMPKHSHNIQDIISNTMLLHRRTLYSLSFYLYLERLTECPQ